MGKRYICDYCDRTFVDDPDSRKKHIQSIGHIRNKNNHYRQYRDLKTTFKEESAKEECRRYRQTGQCTFGENCNYTHYSREDLRLMKAQIEEGEKKNNSYSYITNASLEDWLNKRQETNATAVQGKKEESRPAVISTSHLNLSQLPISLQPVTEEQIFQTDIEFIEWG